MFILYVHQADLFNFSWRKTIPTCLRSGPLWSSFWVFSFWPQQPALGECLQIFFEATLPNCHWWCFSPWVLRRWWQRMQICSFCRRVPPTWMSWRWIWEPWTPAWAARCPRDSSCCLNSPNAFRCPATHRYLSVAYLSWCNRQLGYVMQQQQQKGGSTCFCWKFRTVVLHYFFLFLPFFDLVFFLQWTLHTHIYFSNCLLITFARSFDVRQNLWKTMFFAPYYPARVMCLRFLSSLHSLFPRFLRAKCETRTAYFTISEIDEGVR